jgi:hypothetical protein
MVLTFFEYNFQYLDMQIHPYKHWSYSEIPNLSVLSAS